MKEGFKGERFASLPDNLLETYSKDPLIGDLFLRKIGYFPRVKYHYIQKEHGCDYTMLIYCTDGEGWYEIYGENIFCERMNTSYFRRILLMLLGPTMKIPGLSIGCILKARTVNTTSREVVFRAALPPTIIHAFKTACCCLRKSTIVFSGIYPGIHAVHFGLPASVPVLFHLSGTVPFHTDLYQQGPELFRKSHPLHAGKLAI